MGTRPGTIDPGVLLYLEQQNGMDATALQDLLYNKSGLKGVSGISGDMRTLLASEAAGAKDAIALFVFRLVREIGALTASLGGLDGLVFTAGIGEHSAEIRAMTAQKLAFLGAKLNAAANQANATRISQEDSGILMLVIPTNEEEMIARHMLALVA